MPNIFDAVESGSLSEVQQLLNNGEAINQRDWGGDTPIIWAIKRIAPNIMLVEMLIKAGADLNIANARGESPLRIMVTSVEPLNAERLKLIDILIKNGANVDTIDSSKFTLLMSTLWRIVHYKPLSRSFFKLIKMLIKGGANLNFESSEKGETPLIIAMSFVLNNRRDSLDDMILWQQQLMEALINAGADVNFVGTQGNTPLMQACRSHTEFLKKLLLHGADVNEHSFKKEYLEYDLQRYNEKDPLDAELLKIRNVLLKFGDNPLTRIVIWGDKADLQDYLECKRDTPVLLDILNSGLAAAKGTQQKQYISMIKKYRDMHYSTFASRILAAILYPFQWVAAKLAKIITAISSIIASINSEVIEVIEEPHPTFASKVLAVILYSFQWISDKLVKFVAAIFATMSVINAEVIEEPPTRYSPELKEVWSLTSEVKDHFEDRIFELDAIINNATDKDKKAKFSQKRLNLIKTWRHIIEPLAEYDANEFCMAVIRYTDNNSITQEIIEDINSEIQQSKLLLEPKLLLNSCSHHLYQHIEENGGDDLFKKARDTQDKLSASKNTQKFKF